KRLATIRITNPSLRWNKIAQKCFPCRQTRLFTLRGWDSVRYRQARYFGGRVGHGRGTVRVTNNFAVFELELDAYKDHEHRSNYMCCSEPAGVDIDRAADPLPVEGRFSPVTKNVLSFFLYGSPSMS